MFLSPSEIVDASFITHQDKCSDILAVACSNNLYICQVDQYKSASCDLPVDEMFTSNPMDNHHIFMELNNSTHGHDEEN